MRIVLAHGFDGFWLALPIVGKCLSNGVFADGSPAIRLACPGSRFSHR